MEWQDHHIFEKCMKEKKWPKENWNSLGKRSGLYVCTYAHAHTYPYTQTHPLRFSEIFDNMMHLKNTYDSKPSKMFGM